jgi:hypothetical protein
MARVDEEWMDAPAFAGQQGTDRNLGETPIRFMPRRARDQGEPS